MRLQWAFNPGKSTRWKEHTAAPALSLSSREWRKRRRKGRSMTGPSGSGGEARIKLCPEFPLCGEGLGLDLSSGMNEPGKVSGCLPAAGPARVPPGTWALEFVDSLSGGPICTGPLHEAALWAFFVDWRDRKFSHGSWAWGSQETHCLPALGGAAAWGRAVSILPGTLEIQPWQPRLSTTWARKEKVAGKGWGLWLNSCGWVPEPLSAPSVWPRL